MTRIPSPYRSSVVRTGARVSNGVRIANQAAAWMEDHEEEFMAILGEVRKLRLEKVYRDVRGRVARWCCENDVMVSAREGYFVDNTLWAALCRYLVLLDPSLEGDPLLMRHSDVDFVGLAEVSWYDFGAEVRADAVA